MNSIIFFHAIFAILAIPLGLLIFLKKKGTFLHKRLGWFWILFLVIVSISAVFIQSLNPGQFSTIHLLIPFTLISLIYAIWSIRKFKETKKIKYRYSHMYTIIGVYIGVLITAGTFTLMPGRIIHSLLFL
tara:strand:+ start:33 stop:422 length:390 start_codon:yes stop_codon:yes gene_type:complete